MTASHSPFVQRAPSVRSVMLRVLAALLPAIFAYAWFFGSAIVLQLLLASATALLAEALVLRLRNKPVWLFVSDGSALLTAWLVALSFPPIGPWWLVVLGTLAAIVVAKHLYGGLGQNPFNPAMVGFALMIVAYPQVMSQWPLAESGHAAAYFSAILGERQLDGITTATPLDALRTALHSGKAVIPAGSTATAFAVIAAGYALGGAWLLRRRLISWHLPLTFLLTLSTLSAGFHWLDPLRYASPLFHIASGGTLLAAFFIITDPVSGCATPRGKLIFGALVALLTWIIRTWGAYPDGIAFAVLLVNMAVPLIDMRTQPPVFGHKNGKGPHSSS